MRIMSVKLETKHVLDNLFCLDEKDGLHLFLTKKAIQGTEVNDVIIAGNKLLLGASSYIMNDHETNTMNQLNDYDEHCFKNETNMDKTFYLLFFYLEDFHQFKSRKTSSLSKSTISTDSTSIQSLILTPEEKESILHSPLYKEHLLLDKNAEVEPIQTRILLSQNTKGARLP